MTKKDKKDKKVAKTPEKIMKITLRSSTPKKKREDGICPRCGSNNLEYGSIIIGDFPLISYPYRCIPCRTVGIEHYNLEFVEQTIDEEEER